LYPIVAVAAFTGARRNEILALRWGDLDPTNKTLRIERAIDETKGGLAFKAPKTKRGIRTMTLDDDLIVLLKAERERHLRLISGVPDGVAVDLSLVKLPDGALVFPPRLALRACAIRTPSLWALSAAHAGSGSLNCASRSPGHARDIAAGCGRASSCRRGAVRP
jgi:integrase